MLSDWCWWGPAPGEEIDIYTEDQCCVWLRMNLRSVEKHLRLHLSTVILVLLLCVSLGVCVGEEGLEAVTFCKFIYDEKKKAKMQTS